MGSYYDLALMIDSDMTLSQLKTTFKKLESLNIIIDYNSLEINEIYSFFLVQYPSNINIKTIAKIDGIKIDYDAMTYWD